MPVNAHMTLRLAVHELSTLLDKGLSPADFEATRDYLMKNVFVMTARQDQQLGYALDSKWYDIGEFTDYMRAMLRTLPPAQRRALVLHHLLDRPVEEIAVETGVAVPSVLLYRVLTCWLPVSLGWPVMRWLTRKDMI